MIQINYRDSRPFYEQIKDNIIRLITTRILRPDDRLPSVRELASELAINPNTIQRAYRELENEGYIYKISGRGTFVSDAADINTGKKKELFETLDKTVTELLYLSVSEEEITRHIYEMRNKNAGTAGIPKDASSGNADASTKASTGNYDVMKEHSFGNYDVMKEHSFGNASADKQD